MNWSSDECTGSTIDASPDARCERCGRHPRIAYSRLCEGCWCHMDKLRIDQEIEDRSPCTWDDE